MRTVTYTNMNDLINSSLLNKASINETPYGYGFKVFNPMPVCYFLPKSNKVDTNIKSSLHIIKTPNIR